LLRLLSVYVLVSDPRLQQALAPGAQQAAAGQEAGGPDPAMGLYAFSADGLQVRFERGVFVDGAWQGGIYTLNLADGKITPGDLSQPASRYRIEDGQVWLSEELPGSPRLSLSPPGQNVTNPVFAGDGQALAYVEQTTTNRQRLFAVRGADPAILIDEQREIRDMAWAQANDRLVYIAPTAEGDELFLFSFDTRQVVQLTQDGQAKRSPRFSRDSRQIAFLAGPASASAPDTTQFHPFDPAPATGMDVYVIDADGQNQLRLTQTALDETLLAWTADNQVAFSAWLPQWPSVAYLYALSSAGGEPQRLYPAVAIERFSCQPTLPGGNQVKVQIMVSNDGTQPATVPLEVSANRQPLDLLTNRSQFRVQRDELSLKAGETSTLNWTVVVPEDLKVYLAASIESGVDFPISASFCQVTPRRWFIPRLPLLRTTLLLWLIGSVLCLPWLRHMRNKWVWAFWMAYGVLLIGLIAFESWLLVTL
jgi:hypothetical protein